jgi:hypothetical protein
MINNFSTYNSQYPRPQGQESAFVTVTPLQPTALLLFGSDAMHMYCNLLVHDGHLVSLALQELELFQLLVLHYHHATNISNLCVFLYH